MYGSKEIFNLMTHSTYFIYGYMASGHVYMQCAVCVVNNVIVNGILYVCM